jgi:hypothetical protein
VPGLVRVPGHTHGLESFRRLIKEGPVAAGHAERAERERLGEGARLQPVRRLCLYPVTVAERGQRVQEGRHRLPLPVELGRDEFGQSAGLLPGQGQADPGRLEPALIPPAAFHPEPVRLGLEPAGLVFVARVRMAGRAVQQDGDVQTAGGARAQVGVHRLLGLGRPGLHLVPAPGHGGHYELPAPPVHPVVRGQAGVGLDGLRGGCRRLAEAAGFQVHEDG